MLHTWSVCARVLKRSLLINLAALHAQQMLAERIKQALPACLGGTDLLYNGQGQTVKAKEFRPSIAALDEAEPFLIKTNVLPDGYIDLRAIAVLCAELHGNIVGQCAGADHGGDQQRHCIFRDSACK